MEIIDATPPHDAKVAATPSDLAKYREMISEFDLTNEQANDMLACLWDIMSTFARHRIAFDVAEYFNKLAESDQAAGDD